MEALQTARSSYRHARHTVIKIEHRFLYLYAHIKRHSVNRHALYSVNRPLYCRPNKIDNNNKKRSLTVMLAKIR